MQTQVLNRPTKFFLQQILDEHPMFRKSKEEELRKQWFSQADHVYCIPSEVVDRYFTEEEKDRLGLTLREFWSQLTNTPINELQDLPNGDRFLFYGSPRSNWFFSCMLNLVTDASQACIMKSRLIVEPVLRRLLVDLAAHLESVDAALLDDNEVKTLSTCAACHTPITSGSVYMCLASYIMASPYEEMGVVRRCSHSRSWGIGKKKLDGLFMKVSCAPCASRSSACRFKLDDNFEDCSSQWIIVPFNVFNAILAVMNQDIREMPMLNTDAKSDPVFISPHEEDEFHHRFYIRTNSTLDETLSSGVENLTRYARIHLLGRVIELATKQPLTPYVEDKLYYSAMEADKAETHARMAKLNAISVPLTLSKLQDPANDPMAVDFPTAPPSFSSLENIIAKVSREVTKEVTSAIIRDVVEPLIRINKDQLAENQTLRGYIDNCLQANNAERYSNQGEITTLIRRATVQLTDNMNKISTKMDNVSLKVQAPVSNRRTYTPHRALSYSAPVGSIPYQQETTQLTLPTANFCYPPSESSGGLYLPTLADCSSPQNDFAHHPRSSSASKISQPVAGLLDFVNNWQAFPIDSASLSIIAMKWNLKVSEMSTSHRCPVCDLFKDTTPVGQIIYLFHGMSTDAVGQVFSKKAHRGPTCPFVILFRNEIGESDTLALRSFLSYKKASLESLRKAIGCQALIQWLVDHPVDSLGGRTRLTGVFADKGIIRDTTSDRISMDSIRHFWEGESILSIPAAVSHQLPPASSSASSSLSNGDPVPKKATALSALQAVLKKRKRAAEQAAIAEEESKTKRRKIEDLGDPLTLPDM